MVRVGLVFLIILVGCGDDGGEVGADARAPYDARSPGDGGDPDAGGTAACTVPATFADGKSPTAVVHVAPGGDDDTGDGSEATPYATLERAAQDAAPGTAIRLHAGTYAGDQYLSDLRGTAEAPIWIGGAPGETRPVLSGGGEGLHLTRVSYLVVHDLAVTGAASNGINCDDGGAYDDPTATHHVVFDRVVVSDIGSGGNQDCIKLSGVYDYWVINSEMSACGGGGSGSGLDHVGCHRGVVAHNYFHDLSANAVQSKGGSADILIHGNRMVQAGHRALNMGGSTGFEYFRPPLSMTEPNAEARRIVATANVIIGGDTPAAFVGCVDCVFAHNTVIDPDTWLLRILQETTSTALYTFEPATNGLVASNVFYFDNSALSTYVNIGAMTDPDTFVFDHNLFYAHDDPGASQPTLPGTETDSVVGMDPMLDGDHRIGATSPAAGAGTPVSGVPGDHDGACYGDPPSIGAFEIN
jgi:hypothetical protein